ncbi:type IV secretory system conjugative DNA transfer family protein [Lacipirellula sp.]|uniref:type IV secretory system conjugative DNA transfer family protein n=1 Tax=Lacipirellula sp. TaxID=2691419 RepID=UPI003D0FF055
MLRPFRWLEARIADYQNGLYELLPHLVREMLICTVLVILAFIFGGPIIGALSLCLPLYTAVLFTLNYFNHERLSRRKGHRLQRDDRVRRKAHELCERSCPGDPGILWGKVRIPTKDSEKNFLIVGNIGSGKTLAIRTLMKDQLPLVNPATGRRALIYDSKQDCLQSLAGMGLRCPMHVFNPFDERGVAWDMAQDIDSIPIANTFAEYIIPSSPHATQKYFEEAPQALLAAVLQVFLKMSPGRWTFRQLLLVMQSIERIEQIAAKDHDAHETVQAILSQIGSRGRGNLLSTIVAKTRQYKTIAACWESARGRISVKQWLRESSILVLGNYEPAKAEINRLASMFIDRLSKEVLSLPENSGRQTWLFFDELTEAGELRGLDSLVFRGRSKGCVSVLGFQDIGALYEAYGRERGDAFISQCGNRLYLHLKSPETAEWASRSIGKRESFLEDQHGRLNTEDVVPPEHFYRLPETNPHTVGMHGVYVNGSLGCWTAHYAPPELWPLLPTENRQVESFRLVPQSRYELQPWSENDARQFGILFPSSPANSDGPKGPHFEEEGPLSGMRRFTL